MNSTDKLLRAFIEASGYEIEEVEEVELWRTIPFMGQTERDMLHHKEFCGCVISRVKTDTENHWELHRKIIDYKVTKKAVESNAYQVILDTQGPEFSCIVKYITDHIDDIESSVNDFGILKPMLDYFNRNS